MQLENWAELLNQFLDTLEASGYSEHTLKAYYVDLKQYFMFTTSLDQKTVDDYLMHLSRKGMAPTSLNRFLSSLRKFCSFLKSKVTKCQSWSLAVLRQDLKSRGLF